MAALAFVVLAHTKPHARGERVSAGPGIEYIVGKSDGYLYGTGTIRSGGRVRHSQAEHPGVHPDHVAGLLKSPNIRKVTDYQGPVANGPPVAPTAPAGAVVSRAEHDKVVAQRDALSVENAKLKADIAGLRSQLLAKAQVPVTDAPASSVAKPAPPAPPGDAPPPPAAPPGDNPPPPAPGATDFGAVLGVGVGKLALDIAGGKHDDHLPALREAEVAGKNRSSALAAIDARIKARAA